MIQVSITPAASAPHAAHPAFAVGGDPKGFALALTALLQPADGVVLTESEPTPALARQKAAATGKELPEDLPGEGTDPDSDDTSEDVAFAWFAGPAVPATAPVDIPPALARAAPTLARVARVPGHPAIELRVLPHDIGATPAAIGAEAPTRPAPTVEIQPRAMPSTVADELSTAVKVPTPAEQDPSPVIASAAGEPAPSAIAASTPAERRMMRTATPVPPTLDSPLPEAPVPPMPVASGAPRTKPVTTAVSRLAAQGIPAPATVPAAVRVADLAPASVAAPRPIAVAPATRRPDAAPRAIALDPKHIGREAAAPRTIVVDAPVPQRAPAAPRAIAAEPAPLATVAVPPGGVAAAPAIPGSDRPAPVAIAFQAPAVGSPPVMADAIAVDPVTPGIAPAIQASPVVAQRGQRTEARAVQPAVDSAPRALAGEIGRLAASAQVPPPIAAPPSAASPLAAPPIAAQAEAPAPRRAAPRDPVVEAAPIPFGETARAVQVAAPAETRHEPLDLRRHEWMGAMLDRIEAMREVAGARETSIHLAPDALGSVDISIREDGDRIHVHFAAETAAARTALSEAQPRLAELAEARGVKLGQTSVDSGMAGQGGQRQQAAPARPLPPAPPSARAEPESADQRIA